MPPHLLAQHPFLATSDLDEAQQRLGAIWERHDRGNPKGRRFAIRWHQADLRKSSLAYVHHVFASQAKCQGPLTDHFRLLLPLTGRIDNRINGRQAVLTPSSLVLHAPGQELELQVTPLRLLLLSFDGPFVRNALSRSFLATPALEIWATQFSAKSAAAASLISMSLWLAGELDRPDSIFRLQQRATASIERTLLALFMEVLAAQRPEERYGRSELARGQMALIEAWIEANLSEPFGVEDLADVADVSSRSVQLAFARVRGCTPMQFVLQRRLDLARALLQAPTPATTVTGVAMDCGCFHLGRFAAAYRRRFGEKPSETLAWATITAAAPAAQPQNPPRAKDRS